MLYLEPPFYFIDGVMVYRDHLDPNYYYYMPLMPHLSARRDPSTGRDVPQIQLIKYKSEVVGNGGFLNFDVNLGLSDDARDDIASEIKRQARLDRTPTLVPVPLLDGTVKLMLFGQETAAPTTPRLGGGTAPTTPPPQFVLKIQQNAKPSLYGNNDAAFSVQLDRYGATILEQAMKGEMTPVLVIYSLDYVALRPAFSVRLHIDWDRVQDHMDQSFGQQGLFTSVQIGEAVDKLVEDQAITLEVDNFVPDVGDEGNSNESKVEAAKARVQEMITGAFFTPSLDPLTDKPDGWDKARELITDVGRMGMQAASGGIASIIGTFSYSHNTYKRVDQRRLDVTISERTAVVRTIFPQGHLSGIVHELLAGDDPSKYILEVDADDPWFDRRRVRVRNLGDMAADNLASVQVMLKYGNEPKDVVLKTTGEEATIDWASILDNGAIRPDVTASFNVNLKSDGTGERPTSVASTPRTIQTEVLEVQPAELYANAKVAIVTSPSYKWDRYPRVQVDLQYTDEPNKIRISDSFLLSSDKKEQAWSYFLMDKAKRTYQYRISHRAADNKDVVLPWADGDGELIDIRDPFAASRIRYDIVAAVPRWNEVEQIFVDVNYDDDANDFHQSDSFVFTPEDKAAKAFIVDLRDRTKTIVSFSVTTILVGGVVLEVPTSQTKKSPIVIRTDMRGQRIINVHGPADFAAARIDKITVGIRFQDPTAGIDISDTFDLESAADQRSFEYPYVDQSRQDYEYQALYLLTNGMTVQSDWQKGDQSELVLRAP